MTGERVTLFLRGSVWYARWWDGRKMIWRSLRTLDRRVARRRADEIEADVLSGGGGESQPLDTLIRRYLAGKRVSDLKRYILGLHLERFRAVAPKKAGQVRPRHVEEWLASLSGRYAASTVNDHRRSVHGLLAWAERHEYVTANAVRAVPAYREEQRLVPYLTEEQREATLAACEGRPILLPVAVGFFAGLRRGEICGLHREHIIYERDEIEVRQAMTGKRRVKIPKASKQRVVPLHPRLRAIFEAAPRTTVWACPRGRKPWEPAALTRAIRALGKDLGVPALVGPQVLRSTFATLLLSAGVPIAAVSSWLGHASIKVTQERYARFVRGGKGRIDAV